MLSYQCNSASYRESQGRPSLPCRWSSLQIKVFSVFFVVGYGIPCCGAFCVTLAISLSEGELGSPCFPLYSPRPSSQQVFSFLTRRNRVLGMEIYASWGSSTSSKKVGWVLYLRLWDVVVGILGRLQLTDAPWLIPPRSERTRKEGATHSLRTT